MKKLILLLNRRLSAAIQTKSIFIIAIILLITFTNIVKAQGDWPGTLNNSSIKWMNYTTSNGKVISDPSEVSPPSIDIYFCTQDSSSIKIACDGTNLFFRIQLKDDPKGNPGGFSNNASYLVQLANTSGTFMATVGLDAKLSDDIVYVSTPAGVQTQVYINSVSGTSAMRSLVVPGQAINYYLDFQVPVSSVALIWSGFSANTPMKMFYGTSTTNASINKDYMTGSTVDFTLVSAAKPTSISSGLLFKTTISGNTLLQNVTLSFTDTTARTVVSNENGDYSIAVSYNWSGVITPSKPGGYSFSPSDFSFANVTDDLSGQNFTYFLPVELLSFTAANLKSGIQLSWKTATEKNNYGFEVERQVSSKQLAVGSKSQLEWQKVGFVKGSGNSNTAKDYSFQDNELSSGSYNYRLKQIDNDGSFEYSKMVEASFMKPAKFTLEQNYPNPFNPTTLISYSVPKDGKVKLIVYNLLGQAVTTLVNDYKETGTYSVKFDGTGLSSGLYLYRLESDGFVLAKKMLLTK